MSPSYAKLALEQFYLRTFDQHLKERVGSMLFVAALLVAAHILSPWLAGIWLSGYAACEAGIQVWWRRIRDRLATADEADVRRYANQMIALCAITMAEVCVPFFGAPAGPEGAIISIVFPAGVIMIIAALHTLDTRMFYFTGSVPATAFALNMWRQGEGLGAWTTLAMAVCLVINARSLCAANAAAYASLIQAQLEADRANAAKSTFLATLSHEIRTPLNGVLGMAQAMEAHDLSADQKVRLGVIQRSGEGLLGLLNDVLDMSKIEAGKVQLESLDFDLADALAAAADPFRAIAQIKGLAFETEISLCGYYRGDPTRLRQIIYNLLSNAVKFTSAGSIRLAAAATDHGVSLTIADTGIGMAAETVEHLFNKFAQGDASTTRRFGGTGLGLAISQDLAHLMGGSIRAVSRQGEGTTFSVDLPLTKVADAAPSPSQVAPQPAAEGERSEPVRVLIAEDNATNQLVLTSLLGALGDAFETRMVADGRQAVEAFSAGAFDVILMDVNMPEMDGLAATRAIRQLEESEGRTRTPIIALTANAMSHQVAEHLAAGMDAHVAKPLRLPELVAARNAVLDPGGEARAA